MFFRKTNAYAFEILNKLGAVPVRPPRGGRHAARGAATPHNGDGRRGGVGWGSNNVTGIPEIPQEPAIRARRGVARRIETGQDRGFVVEILG